MAYVLKPEYEGEVRRVILKPSEANSLSFVEAEGRIREKFKLPVLAELKLTYEDEDGDTVTMANDHDLEDAFVIQEINPLRLKVVKLPIPCLQETKARRNESSTMEMEPLVAPSEPILSQQSTGEQILEVPDPQVMDSRNVPLWKSQVAKSRSWKHETFKPERTLEVHETVTCDMCFRKPIVGARFKSLSKINYDLCEECLKENTNPSQYKRIPMGTCRTLEEQEVHETVTCDVCLMKPILGPRYKSKTKFNYDLCGKCYERGKADPGEYERIPLGVEENLEIHRTVTCDVCYMKPIVGPRYKSTTKINYDLCGKCYDTLIKKDPTEYKQIPLRRNQQSRTP